MPVKNNTAVDVSAPCAPSSGCDPAGSTSAGTAVDGLAQGSILLSAGASSAESEAHPGSDLPSVPDDTFSLYDLKVEVVAGDRPFVCSHHVGDYFLVQGENLVFPEGTAWSMYALSAILPVLPAKERVLDPNDWMLSDAEIACPDPNCGARFRITRTATRVQSHGACTVVPLPQRQ